MPSRKSITELIRHEHLHVLQQFHRLDPSLRAETRKAVIRHVCAALELHTQLEEEIFYPALLDAGVQAGALDRSGPEHARIRERVTQVRSLCEDSATPPDSLADALNELFNGVLHHIADEETQLLPAAERFFSAERLAELGTRSEDRRSVLLQPHAGGMTRDLARAAQGKTALVTVSALLAGSLLIGRLRGRRRAPP